MDTALFMLVNAALVLYIIARLLEIGETIMAKQRRDDDYPCGIPIRYRRFHMYDSGTIGFWQAVFLEDYGPWKRGDQFWHVLLDPMALTIRAQIRDGQDIRTVGEMAIRIVPVDPVL